MNLREIKNPDLFKEIIIFDLDYDFIFNLIDFDYVKVGLNYFIINISDLEKCQNLFKSHNKKITIHDYRPSPYRKI